MADIVLVDDDIVLVENGEDVVAALVLDHIVICLRILKFFTGRT